MALYRANNGLGRICRLQLAAGKLGVRSYQRAYAMHCSLRTMDLCQQQQRRGQGRKGLFTITSVTALRLKFGFCRSRRFRDRVPN